MTTIDENLTAAPEGPWSAQPATALWAGDTGMLGSESRRALAQIVNGPYLSAATKPNLWSALLSDERAIRSRLHDLFLDLVIDTDGGFAFVRNADSGDVERPSVVRSQNLTFIDTAMLLTLRQLLLAGQGESRVIVGQGDVYEQLRVYRAPDRDEPDFERRLNSAWRKFTGLGLLHTVGGADEGRVEISPVLRVLVGAEQVRQIAAEYERLAATGSAAEDDEEPIE